MWRQDCWESYLVWAHMWTGTHRDGTRNLYVTCDTVLHRYPSPSLARSLLLLRPPCLVTFCERLVRDQVDRKGEEQRQRDSHTSCGEQDYV